jgi:hypothetical protein
VEEYILGQPTGLSGILISSSSTQEKQQCDIRNSDGGKYKQYYYPLSCEEIQSDKSLPKFPDNVIRYNWMLESKLYSK